MCYKLQKLIFATVSIHSFNARELCDVLGVDIDKLLRAMARMDDAGLLLSEARNGVIAAYTIVRRGCDTVVIDDDTRRFCNDRVRAYLTRQMTMPGVVSQVGNDSGDTVSPENATK